MPEVEAKFRVEDPACMEAVWRLEAAGDFRVAGRREVDQSDLYHDTPDRDVARQGGSLRIRTVDGRPVFTVKTGPRRVGIAVRQEIEEPVDGRGIREWVRGLLTAGRLELDLDPDLLGPVLEIRNRRGVMDLAGPDETRVELVIDRVRFLGPRGEAEGAEVEVELKQGSEDRLRELCDWLQAQYPLAPFGVSKYHQALRLVG